jgi:predicted DNA-binding ribbon-helix-helix protein
VIDAHVREEKVSFASVIAVIDAQRQPDQPLSSACRVWALKQVQART